VARRPEYPRWLSGVQKPRHPDFTEICKVDAAPMAAIIHPLLTLLASLTRQELAQQVTYLKAENQILRSKLPKRIELSNQERRRLLRHGKKLGAPIKGLIKSPNLQAFVERVIQTLKHEVLNGFCVINERHLDHVLRIGADWYNRRRGHSGRDHLPPVRDESEPPVVDLAKDKIVCHI
jgi:hypothetical protein